jgi:Fe-Mn family superoxide dismutase
MGSGLEHLRQDGVSHSVSRRTLLQSGAIAVGGLLFLPIPGCRREPGATAPVPSVGPVPGPTEETMSSQHTLPPLPYAYDALEPHIDAQTVKLHHDKHHQGYVDGANQAQQKLAQLRDAGDYALVDYWEHKLAFHTSGHLLHSLFWENMAPPGKGGKPSADLAKELERAFGGADRMQQQLSAAAKTVEGSGWGILGWDRFSASLSILQCENHQKQAIWSTVPILVVDVWEHAYYLQYQNRRADFIQAWWNLVNWEDVSTRYEQARAVTQG